MLVYEYKCLDCDSYFEEANDDISKIHCLFCNGKNLEKTTEAPWKSKGNSSCSDCKECHGCD